MDANRKNGIFKDFLLKRAKFHDRYLHYVVSKYSYMNALISRKSKNKRRDENSANPILRSKLQTLQIG